MQILTKFPLLLSFSINTTPATVTARSHRTLRRPFRDWWCPIAAQLVSIGRPTCTHHLVATNSEIARPYTPSHQTHQLTWLKLSRMLASSSSVNPVAISISVHQRTSANQTEVWYSTSSHCLLLGPWTLPLALCSAYDPIWSLHSTSGLQHLYVCACAHVLRHGCGLDAGTKKGEDLNLPLFAQSTCSS